MPEIIATTGILDFIVRRAELLATVVVAVAAAAVEVLVHTVGTFAGNEPITLPGGT